MPVVQATVRFDGITADGDCIIDIDYVGTVGNTDMETYSQIWKIAETVIFDCVFMPRGITHGGFASGLGECLEALAY